MREAEYIVEIVIERKRITEKLRMIDQLFHIKYEITHTVLYSIIRYDLYHALDDQKRQQLIKWRDADTIVKCFFCSKASAIR